MLARPGSALTRLKGVLRAPEREPRAAKGVPRAPKGRAVPFKRNNKRNQSPRPNHGAESRAQLFWTKIGSRERLWAQGRLGLGPVGPIFVTRSQRMRHGQQS